LGRPKKGATIRDGRAEGEREREREVTDWIYWPHGKDFKSREFLLYEDCEQSDLLWSIIFICGSWGGGES